MHVPLPLASRLEALAKADAQQFDGDEGASLRAVFLDALRWGISEMERRRG